MSWSGPSSFGEDDLRTPGDPLIRPLVLQSACGLLRGQWTSVIVRALNHW